jgi:hypothetical protein
MTKRDELQAHGRPLKQQVEVALRPFFSRLKKSTTMPHDATSQSPSINPTRQTQP